MQKGKCCFFGDNRRGKEAKPSKVCNCNVEEIYAQCNARFKKSNKIYGYL